MTSAWGSMMDDFRSGDEVFAGPVVVDKLELQRWSMKLFKQARKGAARRKIAFTLTVEQFHRIIKRANGCCEFSGIPFLQTSARYKKNPWKASIDRIDSARPYEKRNCRLVCVAVNLAKHSWDDAVLNQLIDAVKGRHEERRTESDIPRVKALLEKEFAETRIEMIVGIKPGALRMHRLVSTGPGFKERQHKGVVCRYYLVRDVVKWLRAGHADLIYAYDHPDCMARHLRNPRLHFLLS